LFPSPLEAEHVAARRIEAAFGVVALGPRSGAAFADVGQARGAIQIGGRPQTTPRAHGARDVVCVAQPLTVANQRPVHAWRVVRRGDASAAFRWRRSRAIAIWQRLTRIGLLPSRIQEPVLAAVTGLALIEPATRRARGVAVAALKVEISAGFAARRLHSWALRARCRDRALALMRTGTVTTLRGRDQRIADRSVAWECARIAAGRIAAARARAPSAEPSSAAASRTGFTPCRTGFPRARACEKRDQTENTSSRRTPLHDS
jgi:hypothetical protein